MTWAWSLALAAVRIQGVGQRQRREFLPFLHLCQQGRRFLRVLHGWSGISCTGFICRRRCVRRTSDCCRPCTALAGTAVRRSISWRQVMPRAMYVSCGRDWRFARG